MTERLDRIEAILDRVAERQDQLAEQQQQTQVQLDGLTERQDRTQVQLDQMAKRQDRTQVQLDQMAERQGQMQTEMNANFEYLGSEVGQLIRSTVEFRQQFAEFVERSEQDRSQAMIDRAEFRSTVDQILVILAERFTRNGDG